MERRLRRGASAKGLWLVEETTTDQSGRDHNAQIPTCSSCRLRDWRADFLVLFSGIFLYFTNQEVKHYWWKIKLIFFLTENCFVAHDTYTGFASSICTMLRVQSARIEIYTRQSWAVPLISPSWPRSCSLQELIRKKCRLVCSWACNGVISSWSKFLRHPH